MGRVFFFFLMIRRPPRSTLDRSSAASDVYKRQLQEYLDFGLHGWAMSRYSGCWVAMKVTSDTVESSVSYTHLRAHETVLDLVCRLLLETKTHMLTVNVSTEHTHHETL